MELIFVRHGDPDYSIDSLTEAGWMEARALVDRFKDMDISEFYVSPLGRAKDTASFTLEEMKRTASKCDWLREFDGRVYLDMDPELLSCYPDRRTYDNRPAANVCWDMLPEYRAKHPELYHPSDWRKSSAAINGDVVSKYDYVTGKFDELLQEHGYLRENGYYRAVQPNRDRLVFFCHFGVSALLFSHLMGVSPFVLWHTLSMAPSSVSTAVTEERKEGISVFRFNKIGDVSHLFSHKLEPSFACRFCETFDNPTERH